MGSFGREVMSKAQAMFKLDVDMEAVYEKLVGAGVKVTKTGGRPSKESPDTQGAQFLVEMPDFSVFISKSLIQVNYPVDPKPTLRPALDFLSKILGLNGSEILRHYYHNKFPQKFAEEQKRIMLEYIVYLEDENEELHRMIETITGNPWVKVETMENAETYRIYHTKKGIVKVEKI